MIPKGQHNILHLGELKLSIAESTSNSVLLTQTGKTEFKFYYSMTKELKAKKMQLKFIYKVEVPLALKGKRLHTHICMQTQGMFIIEEVTL